MSSWNLEGTGGDEACIFVDIFRMFTMFLKKNHGLMKDNSNEGGTKGFREVTMSISGEEVYGHLNREFIEFNVFQKHTRQVHTQLLLLYY